MYFLQRIAPSFTRRVPIAQRQMMGRRWVHMAAEENAKITEQIKRKKELIYRAGYHGWLELDVLIGNFAKRFCMDMTAQEVDEFEDILMTDAPDLFKIVSGQRPIPEEMESNTVIWKILDYVQNDRSAPYQQKVAHMYMESQNIHRPPQ